jgi:hypothetical protein
MAATYTPNFTIFGDMRVSYGTATIAGLTSGAFASGLDRIYGGVVAPCSSTSAVPNFQYRFNIGSASTAIGGMVMIYTCTIGDDYSVFVWGK